MKYLLSAVLVASAALSGCSTMALDDERVVVVDGQPEVVKVTNMSSIDLEIDPYKVVCDLPVADGTTMKGECLQFRQPFQRNFSPLPGDIKGFNFEPGYRYMINVRQEAVADPESGVVRSVWILNDVISKTYEAL